MYWGSAEECSIKRAGMDGSNPRTFVSELHEPVGVVIDFSSSRLYWADYQAKKIQSCGLDYGKVVGPWGTAVVDGFVYWSQGFARRVGSVSIDGGKVHSVCNQNYVIVINLVSPDVVFPRNRTYSCKQKCPGVCVLNPTYYTCL